MDTSLIVLVSIAAVLVTAGLFFYLGMRFALRTVLPEQLPGMLARMTPKEISELAAKAAKERPEN